MNDKVLFFLPDGTVRAVYDDSLPLAAIGTVTKHRASHVLPCHPIKRAAFRVLRAVFGERGKVADYCRGWKGPWEVRFTETPHLVSFTHKSRRVCIAFEVRTLNERFSQLN